MTPETYNPKINNDRIERIESRLNVIEEDIRKINHDLNNILMVVEYIKMRIEGEL